MKFFRLMQIQGYLSVQVGVFLILTQTVWRVVRFSLKKQSCYYLSLFKHVIVWKHTSESLHLFKSLRKNVKYLKKIRLLIGVESTSWTGSEDWSGNWWSKLTIVFKHDKSNSLCNFSLWLDSNVEYWAAVSGFYREQKLIKIKLQYIYDNLPKRNH